jgi:hypothetical protein
MDNKNNTIGMNCFVLLVIYYLDRFRCIKLAPKSLIDTYEIDAFLHSFGGRL